MTEFVGQYSLEVVLPHTDRRRIGAFVPVPTAKNRDFTCDRVAQQAVRGAATATIDCNLNPDIRIRRADRFSRTLCQR